MRRFVLDTNVLIADMRNSPVMEKINSSLDLQAEDVEILIPIAVKAEILSLATQLGWGEKKMDRLNLYFREVYLIHTNDEIVEAYIQLDAYSQGRLLGKPLPRGMTAGIWGKMIYGLRLPLLSLRLTWLRWIRILSI